MQPSNDPAIVDMAAAEKEKKRPSVSFLKLFSFADFYDCVLMALGSIGACIHGASVPVFFIFFGKLINIIGLAYLFPQEASHKVAKYSLDFVYLSVVILFSSWLEVACWMHTGERQAAKIRKAYLRSMLSQDISLFDTEISTGEVISAITSEILVVQDAISEKVGNFMHFISRFIAGFAIGFASVWQISLVTLSIVPFIALAGGIYAFVSSGLIVRVRKSYVKANEIAEEVIGNVRTVQAFTGEEKAVSSYQGALRNTYNYGRKAGLAKGLGLGSLHFVLFLSWALLIWFTSIVVHKGIANGGESFTTMLNVVIAGLSLGQAAPDISTFMRASAAAYPIFQMIERNTEDKTGRKLGNVNGDILFKDVTFTYPSRPDVVIFDKLNFVIPAGKVVALVGGSGSGKSTMISLIERFYEPTDGAVMLDGNDIRYLDLKWLRGHIGLVNQEPVLFATTIRENIMYGKDDATSEEITNAAKLSEAISFINNLPEGFETQVGERGIQLSGGQKQRISISRAIVKNPSILLLDEATSALDAESEKIVQEALDRVMVGRTTVVVAHRLSTVRNADIIAVVGGGKIIESGSHDELISNPDGAYSSLLRIQEAASPNLNHTPSLPVSTKPLPELPITETTSSIHQSVNQPDTTKQAKVTVGRLYSMIRPDWKYGLCGTLGSFIAGSQMPLFALGIAQALVSYYMDWETTQNEVKRISILFCCGSVITVIVHTIEHTTFGIMGERLTLRVRQKMFSAILRNEIGWFDKVDNTSSMLASRLESDATLLRTIVVDRSTILLENLGLVVTAFIISFILNWRLTLVVLATYPLIISGHISEKIFMQGYGGNLSKAYLKANMLAGESISNIRTVVAFCAEEKVLDLYSKELLEPSERSFRRGQMAGILYGVSQFFIFSSYGLALWYGSILMEKGLSSFESVMKTFMVLIVTALVMGEVLALAPDLLKGNQMVVSVFELLDRRTQVVGDTGEELSNVEGTIELKGVHFSYPSRPDVTIFSDFNLLVPSGKSMALVGQSGSGKSSVLSLVLRFYDPTAGIIMIDGQDIKKLKLKSLRRHIGLVQQEPALFATTIYENIFYGKEGASESEVMEAAKLANAHSFISSLPEGYSTKVGERGIQMSGGQRQRIAIARAVLKNPEILLLDEATSALDVESERVVQQALDRLMRDRTTVVVAHRLSTIKNSDMISVIQDGKIIEQGSHNILVENKNGPYSKLISLQQRQRHHP
ncbi:P-loop containing nucleoside triphosphate hydrolase [Arabidopsis suecica]|uniref:P-loop containing nucleoside triphosphate hydrolase n=1 Tax=Arabidopsis suecica TaxID=45249 RepID=A0A8T2C8Q3_ARASU|nr:P-loop containing nucleoside triphosphate hydrolase [Arabidopsis suecica]